MAARRRVSPARAAGHPLATRPRDRGHRHVCVQVVVERSGRRPADFGDVDAYLDTHAATRTLVAHLYFSGGAIALVAVALAGTVLAWIPSRGAGAAGYTAIVAAVAGAAVSCVAPVLTSTVSPATWYGRAAQGCWVAVAGFALLALAATLARPSEPVR